MKRLSKEHITLFILRHFIVYCLVASVLMKPVSLMFVQLTDIKVEYYIDFEENVSSEKELNTDFENEDRLIVFTNLNLIISKKDLLQDYFNLQEHFLEFNPNIQLPPPKV